MFQAELKQIIDCRFKPNYRSNYVDTIDEFDQQISEQYKVTVEPHVNPLIEAMRIKLRKQKLLFNEYSEERDGELYTIFKQVSKAEYKTPVKVKRICRPRKKTWTIKSCVQVTDTQYIWTHLDGRVTHCSFPFEKGKYEKIAESVQKDIDNRIKAPMAYSERDIYGITSTEEFPYKGEIMTLPKHVMN